MREVAVRTTIIGRRDDPWLPPVGFSVSEDGLNVRSLIERTVAEQVRDVAASIRLRKDGARSTRKDVDRAYMSPEEIEEARERGEVVRPKEAVELAEPSADEAIARAIAAFEHGRFLVAVDGVQYVRIDDNVTLRSNSDVEFIRLVPLVGG